MEDEGASLEFLNNCMNITTPDYYCPAIVDDFQLCWPPTMNGTTINQTCPPMEAFNSDLFVYKQCDSSGKWMSHPNFKSDNPWTNMTSCIDMEKYDFVVFINRLYVWGYSVSLIPLFVSLVIFLSFKALRCTRIRIHTQLFLSIFFNNILWIIWHLEIVDKSSEAWVQENPLWCQMIYITKTYFMLTTYFWMFCEALYLHRSLVIVFVKEEYTVCFVFLVIGWGTPVIITLIYVIVRINILEDTELCWAFMSNIANWILVIPVCISLIASFVFLLYILRVIMTITYTNHVVARVKKASRAALILIPLFGLHFLLIPIRPEKGTTWERVHEYIYVAFISLQGVPVSILFCFVNQDVHQAIRGYFTRRIYIRRCSNFQYNPTPLEGSRSVRQSAVGLTMKNSQQRDVTGSTN